MEDICIDIEHAKESIACSLTDNSSYFVGSVGVSSNQSFVSTASNMDNANEDICHDTCNGMLSTLSPEAKPFFPPTTTSPCGESENSVDGLDVPSPVDDSHSATDGLFASVEEALVHEESFPPSLLTVEDAVVQPTDVKCHATKTSPLTDGDISSSSLNC